MTGHWDAMGQCESCGTSDAECDDHEYTHAEPCCDLCHHVRPARATWSTMPAELAADEVQW